MNIRGSRFIQIFTDYKVTYGACKTSAEEINIRTWVLNGIIVWLWVSKSRNILDSLSVLGTIYESNSKKDCFPENQKSGLTGGSL